MFKSYIKIAWRNIFKNRFHSVINVFGLSIGIAFSLLIGAYVWGELQVNNNLKNAPNQYIIQTKWTDPNMGPELATLGPLAKALKEQYPILVANYYRWDGITSNVSKGSKSFREPLQVCDSTMFNMYGFQLAHGDANTAFNDPFSVIITEQRAIKYFGKTDVVGQSLTIENFSGSKHDFVVSAVMMDPSENSVTHLNAANDNQVFIPESNLKFFGRDMNQWLNVQIASFIELQKGVSPEALTEPIKQLVKQNTAANVSANIQPYLVPLNKYYLDANNGLVKKMLYTVSMIAAFILLMALINFINISISKSSTRIREIGVRKTLGGLRKQLLAQFLIESIMLVLCAMVFALVLYYFANPLLANILGKPIATITSFPTYFVAIPVALILFIGLLAGLYPALVLSSLKAVDSIKGKLRTVTENIVLRKTLVGVQFCTAAVVFIGAIIVSKQVSLFFSNNLGYDKEFIVSAQLPRDWTAQGVAHMRAMKSQFTSMPQVSNATLSYEIPNGGNSGSVPLYPQGTDSTRAIQSLMLVTDEQYASTYKIPLKTGVFFNQQYSAADSSKIVINETAAKAFGWSDPNDAVGKIAYAPGGFPLTITGVVSDFHFGSMQNKIQPVVFINVDLNKIYRFFSFKLKPGNVGTSIDAVQQKWAAVFPGAAFDYSFMDDSLKKLYQTEIQLKKASQSATVLAIIIVVLGVLGLVSISVQKRTKEIGIRKVLGAAATNIIALFLKEFLPVIAIAGIVAIPISYYIMHEWLNSYTYRVAITADPFLIAICFLGLTTTLLIAIQIINATRANPVKNLRTE